MPLVVLQDLQGDLAEQHDSHEVDDGHDRHGEVGEVPHEVERGDGAEHDHRAHGDAVHLQVGFVLRDEEQVRFAVRVVADDGAEGEEQDGDGDELPARAADLAGERHLRELDAFHRTVQRHAGEQDDEGGAAANDERVGEHA